MLYTSEDAPPGTNADWLPVAWSLESRRLSSAAVASLSQPHVRVRLYARAAPAAGASAGAGAAVPLIDEVLDLRELRFLPFSPTKVLEAARGSSSVGRRAGEPRVEAADGAGGAALPAAAAGFSLTELPLNTLFIALCDGSYVSAATYDALRPPQLAAVELSGGAVKSPAAAMPAVLQAGAGATSAAAATAAQQQLGSPQRAPSSGAGAAVAGAGAPKGGGAARHTLRGAFDGLNRLMQLRRETEEAERDEADAHSAVARTLAEQGLGGAAGEGLRLLGASQVRSAGLIEDAAVVGAAAASPAAADDDAEEAALLVHAARVAHLAAARDAALAHAAATASEVAAARSALSAECRDASEAARELRAVNALLPGMEAELDGARNDVRLLRALVGAKQLSLLAELRTLYPITEQDRGARRYAIRGIGLPPADALLTAPEEQVSTALGYTAHAVLLAAKYLGVPLRFAIAHLGSRSSMRDEVLGSGVGGAAREWPLFWKGAPDKDGVRVALRMLHRDVAQLLASQGIAPPELLPGGAGAAAPSAHILVSLARLYSVLLDAPLPPLGGGGLGAA